MPYGWVAAAAVVGDVLQSNSADKAASAQERAAAEATAEQQREYDQTRTDQQPFMQEGYAALGKMADLLGLSGNTSAEGYGSLNKRFTGADLQDDPGYQFELAQGLKTQQNSAAMHGGLYSGEELKALTKYGNDYASTKYGEAYDRFNHDQDTTYNRLASQAGLGQTATTATDAAGQHAADQISGNIIGAGNARGAADIAQGNAWGNAVGQAAGAWWMRPQGQGFQPNAYGTGSEGGYAVNQGNSGGDVNGSFWGTE